MKNCSPVSDQIVTNIKHLITILYNLWWSQLSAQSLHETVKHMPPFAMCNTIIGVQCVYKITVLLDVEGRLSVFTSPAVLLMSREKPQH